MTLQRLSVDVDDDLGNPAEAGSVEDKFLVVDHTLLAVALHILVVVLHNLAAVLHNPAEVVDSLPVVAHMFELVVDMELPFLLDFQDKVVELQTSSEKFYNVSFTLFQL